MRQDDTQAHKHTSTHTHTHLDSVEDGGVQEVKTGVDLIGDKSGGLLHKLDNLPIGLVDNDTVLGRIINLGHCWLVCVCVCGWVAVTRRRARPAHVYTQREKIDVKKKTENRKRGRKKDRETQKMPRNALTRVPSLPWALWNLTLSSKGLPWALWNLTLSTKGMSK